MSAAARMSATEAKALLAVRVPRNKYGNRKTVLDGITFDSKGEAHRWTCLRLLEHAGQIRDLKRQVPFVLTASGQTIGKIVVDFTYWRGVNFVAEDFKSSATITPLFRWKAKHLLHEHGVKVEIVS